jgi:hypothetical protein
LDSRLGQEAFPSPQTASGAEVSRQEAEICCASFAGNMRCTPQNQPRTGNRVEPSAHRFWAEGSDKRPSAQYLRPNIQPIYHMITVPTIRPQNETEEAVKGWLKGKSVEELHQFLSTSWVASLLSSEAIEELYQELQQQEAAEDANEVGLD